MLTLTHVSKRYGGTQAREVLRSVNLELPAGQCLAVMGESGVGKSTLLNLAAGLDRPDTGQIVFDGDDLLALDDDAVTLIRRRKIGFVFQAFHVLPNLSAAQNVALPLLLNGMRRHEAAMQAATALASVGLEGHANALPREMSGGQLQRVAIARALVHQPRLVLADEPTGNLDHDTAMRVLRLLRDSTQRTGTGVLLVTHSAAVAAIADQVLRLTPNGLEPHIPSLA
ncbi:MAG TPA: ABC transporter ATP-binding protein [Trinickia sp.]|jgi:putative ABC transport system ATP-binding protein|uniref:ABC transporter ATP-binding protein n=1 Tax=Trinickia sp. TaxID=2571163 RepID=UPI002C0658B0|nr:ABC transporter ATP-binding protein [Trinickia sp.]HTI19131.1 ABC transporter ATP-binding protein [Trinickia sp.]